MNNDKIIPLSVSNFKKMYGSQVAVEELSFLVKPGEIFGLLGPNGAGKSTTIECILGTKLVDGGDVQVLGESPWRNRKLLFERIGVQFQNSQYHELITVREIYRMFAVLYTNPLPMEEMLARFSLDGMAKKRVSELSGGERQKLSIVLALINRPQIVFLDELTTGLDPNARRVVWSVLKELKQQGMTIFLTSHYMDEVSVLCDRILIIDQGREIISGTPQEVISSSGKKTLEESYLYYTGKGADNETYQHAV